MSARRYFGTDGIRGRVGDGPISADFVLRLGNAYGHALTAAAAGGDRIWRKPMVVIGGRISTTFEPAEAGLVAAGWTQLMGRADPALAHLTIRGADGGIVISASHNPHHDNGIKFSPHRAVLTTPPSGHRGGACRAIPHGAVRALGKAVRTRDTIGRYVEPAKIRCPGFHRRHAGRGRLCQRRHLLGRWVRIRRAWTRSGRADG
jgi:phosphoglucosamine mutase